MIRVVVASVVLMGCIPKSLVRYKVEQPDAVDLPPDSVAVVFDENDTLLCGYDTVDLRGCAENWKLTLVPGRHFLVLAFQETRYMGSFKETTSGARKRLALEVRAGSTYEVGYRILPGLRDWEPFFFEVRPSTPR